MKISCSWHNRIQIRFQLLDLLYGWTKLNKLKKMRAFIWFQFFQQNSLNLFNRCYSAQNFVIKVQGLCFLLKYCFNLSKVKIYSLCYSFFVVIVVVVVWLKQGVSKKKSNTRVIITTTKTNKTSNLK